MQHAPESDKLTSHRVWDSAARSEWPEAPDDPTEALSFRLGNDMVRPWYGPTAGGSKICLGKVRHSELHANGCINLEEIRYTDPKIANSTALKALNAGAAGIIFCDATDPSEIPVLLDRIHARHCWIGFSAENYSAAFLSALSGMFNAESSESEMFNGALFNTSESGFSNIEQLNSFQQCFPNFRTLGLSVSDGLSLNKALLVARSAVTAGSDISSIAILLPTGFKFFDTIINVRALRMAISSLGIASDSRPFIAASVMTDSISASGPGREMTAAATAALAALLGGVDAICIRSASGSDYHFRNIPLVLSHEAHLDKVRDPLCGSWFIEELTFTRAAVLLQHADVLDPAAFLTRSLNKLSDDRLSGDAVWKTREGIEVNRAYPVGEADAWLLQSAVPGVFPFLRGPYATMYARRPWTIRQYAGFSSAEESNRFYRSNLAAGQTGLSIAFDLPTHRGYDSDHPRVTGDVGKAGVAIDSVEDMKLLLDGIPLDRMSVSMTMNGAVLPVMAFYIVTAEEQGVSPHQLTGTIQNDILKEFMVRNTYIYPPEPSMRIVTDVMEYCSDHMPRFNSISVSGYHMHEAGAPADLELAYTLADGLEYLRAAIARGLTVDEVAPRISFFWGIGMNFFMEIAKMRAARLLWAEQVNVFDPKDARSCMLRVHCQTSGWSLAAQDPLNNVTRTAIEAVAAVLGGTQSLHTNAMDEALALPSEYAASVARDTQLFLQRDSGITKVVDPFGGSHLLDHLTGKLIEKARIVLKDIDRAGGMTEYVKSGVPKRNIARAASERQARIDSGEEIIVGVNRFISGLPAELPVREIDQDKVRLGQEARLNGIRGNRDESGVRKSLDALEAGARTNENLLALCVTAARNRCTLGEISMTLERVFGRYITQSIPTAGVYSSSMKDPGLLKRVQEKSDEFAKSHGRRPRMLVAKIGQDGHDRGAQVVASAFADFGFDVDIGPLFATPAEVARQAAENDVHVVGVSTLAGGHNRLIPELIRELGQAGMGREVLVVAGGVIPDADRVVLMEAGVRMIFGPGTNLPVAASGILDQLLAINHRIKP